MSEPIVYRFEDIGPELDLVPLAARRALDHAGLKVGLDAWRGLSRDARAAVVAFGSAETVDSGGVRDAVAGTNHAPCEGRSDPDPSELPPEIAAIGLTTERWRGLRALDRWALASLAGRGRTQSLAQLAAELSG